MPEHYTRRKGTTMMSLTKIAAIFAVLFLLATPALAQEAGFIETANQMAADGLRATAEAAGSMVDQAKEVAVAIKPDLKVLVSDLLGHLRSGGEFIGEQTPLLFEEIILWGIVRRLPWMLVAAVMFGFGFHLRRWSLTYEFHPNLDGRVGALAGWVALYSVSAIMFTVALSSMLKPLVAPRLYLIEELVRLAS